MEQKNRGVVYMEKDNDGIATIYLNQPKKRMQSTNA